MKLTRRWVLRAAAVGAAVLALPGCASSALLGGGWRVWLRRLLGLEPEAPQPAAGEEGPEQNLPSEPAAPPEPSLPAYDPDPLTGEKRAPHPKSGRMIGVMVNNICASAKQNARPHRGISEAKLLIECKVEGKISRLCAVFDDVDAIPEVGPLRSGRDQFLQLLMPWQALYYHDGESIFCTQYIKQWEYWDLNIGGKSYFNTPTHARVAHRDKRDGQVAYEHTEFTSGEEIRKAAENAGISLKYDYEQTFFSFADYRTGAEEDFDGCSEAAEVLVRHSANYQSAFDYDPDTACYKMQMYSGRTGKFEDTVDENTGKQLEFANLVICFAPIAAYPGDSADVQQVQFAGGGEAWVCTRGRVKICQWTKPAPDQPLELWDGAETVTLNRGRTYLALVDEDEQEGCSAL